MIHTIKILNTPVKYAIMNDTFWYCRHDIMRAAGYGRAQHLYRAYRNFVNVRPLGRAAYLDETSVKFLMSKSRKPAVAAVLDAMGCPDVVVAPCKEVITTGQICAMFPTLAFIPQFPVAGYRLDLYSARYNIVVECDEAAHRGYNQERDAERTEIINRALGSPAWVRFNPDAPDFSMVPVIAEIASHLTNKLNVKAELK